MSKIYDVIIIGAGAAGMSAGIYSGRAKMKTLILDQTGIGGQAKTTNEIVNYPGVRQTTGPELMEEMRKQAVDFGAVFEEAEVKEVLLDKEVKVIKTNRGDYHARSIIIATGATPRQLGFPGEKEYRGRGIAYCATCDGEFYSGLEVFVVGAGFAAAEEAIFLTRFARKVTVIAREPEFTCAKSIGDKVLAHPKIEVKFNTEVLEATGDELLRRATFINNRTKETFEYVASEEDGTFGIFIFAGYVPQTDVFLNLIEMDRAGYILTDENMQTSIKGVYAAGDLRPKALRQIVTAVSDGAIASLEAEKYVALEKERLGIKDELEEVKPLKEEKVHQPDVKRVVREGRSALLNDGLRQQIATVLGKMESNISLVTIVDERNEKSLELRDLVIDIANLGEKLEIIVEPKGVNLELEAKIHADKFPIVALLDQNGDYSGVKFHGVPGGHELNSFLLAIYNLAGPGQALEESIKEKIKSIKNKANLKVAVSLSCHLCPDVVVAAQRVAIENPNIETEMIDIANFPELKSKYKVMSVPAIIVNDEKVSFGSKSLQEIISLIGIQ